MFRLLLRGLIGLTVLWVVPVLLIRPQPYDTSPVQALLQPPPDCLAPCFMGIRPGTTTLEEALRLLKGHEWVREVEMTIYELDTRGLRGYGTIAWAWNATHPPEIDITYPGQMNYRETYGGTVVESLSIRTYFPPVVVEAWSGPPDAARINMIPDVEVSYLLTYSTHSAWNSIKTTLPCPVRLMDYWHSKTEISMRPPQRPGEIAPVTDLARWC